MMHMEQERYKHDVDDTMTKLRSLVDDLKQERAELSNQLDIEKRYARTYCFCMQMLYVLEYEHCF